MLGWLKKKNIPVLSPKEGYDLWASTYSTESNPIKDLSNGLVEQFLPELSGKSILDVGCGTGHFCTFAEEKNAGKIIGVDLSDAMIQQAKKNCVRGTFYCADLSSFNIELPMMDVIIVALVIGHIENIAPVVTELSSLLKPGGQLILTDFHPVLTLQHAKRTFKNPLTGETNEIKHYFHSLDEIKNLLTQTGLAVDRTEEPQWNQVPVVYGLRAIKNNHGSAS